MSDATPIWSKNPDLEPLRGDQPERVLALLGLPTCGREGHPRAEMWLTRKMVHCPRCGLALNRETYRDVAAEVERLNPKVHCVKWRPGDPPDRYHGRWCLRPRPRLVEAQSRGGATREGA